MAPGAVTSGFCSPVREGPGLLKSETSRARRGVDDLRQGVGAVVRVAVPAETEVDDRWTPEFAGNPEHVEDGVGDVGVEEVGLDDEEVSLWGHAAVNRVVSGGNPGDVSAVPVGVPGYRQEVARELGAVTALGHPRTRGGLVPDAQDAPREGRVVGVDGGVDDADDHPVAAQGVRRAEVGDADPRQGHVQQGPQVAGRDDALDGRVIGKRGDPVQGDEGCADLPRRLVDSHVPGGPGRQSSLRIAKSQEDDRPGSLLAGGGAEAGDGRAGPHPARLGPGHRGDGRQAE
jgi:hypothetical protein